MIKKINIVGIELDNYTVREVGINVERMITEKSFIIVQEVDMDTLMLAKQDEKVRTGIEMADLTIISEMEILEAAGENRASSVQRKHEIDNRLQLLDLLKKAERNNKTVYILGETVASVEQMKAFVKDEFSRLRIAGVSALENYTQNIEAVVNDINAATSNIILSVLPTPTRELFLIENKGKLLADMWYGVAGNNIYIKKTGLIATLRKYIKVRKLTKHISEYENHTTENENHTTENENHTTEYEEIGSK